MVFKLFLVRSRNLEMRLLIFFLFQSKTDYAKECSCLCGSLGSGKMYVKALATVGKFVCLFSYCYGVFTATLLMFSFTCLLYMWWIV